MLVCARGIRSAAGRSSSTGEGDTMAQDVPWMKEAYAGTVTSECWWFTPYDKDDPGHWDAVSKDTEMQ